MGATPDQVHRQSGRAEPEDSQDPATPATPPLNACAFCLIPQRRPVDGRFSELWAGLSLIFVYGGAPSPPSPGPHPPPLKTPSQAFVHYIFFCCLMCKYVLQDGLGDLLACIALPCSIHAAMEKLLKLKPNIHLPPPPPLWTHRTL